MIELGYEPVAVAGKRALGEAWSTRPNTIEAITAERTALPSAVSTGLRTGRLVGVDIDALDPTHAERCKFLAFDILGYTLLERIGRKGAMHCYRNATPLLKVTVAAREPVQAKDIKSARKSKSLAAVNSSSPTAYTLIRDALTPGPMGCLGNRR